MASVPIPGQESRRNMDVEDVRRTLTSRAAGKEAVASSTQSASDDVGSPMSGLPVPAHSLALEATSARSQRRRGRAIARRLLAVVQCPMCRKTMHDPVTLPCGHSSCLACIAAATKASPLSSLPQLPSSSYRPPRLPLASSTVPCGVAGCPRSAIGRGLGVWAGHMASFGPSAVSPCPCVQDGGASPDVGPGSTPFDGFVVGRPDDSLRLTVIPPQKADSVDEYAVAPTDGSAVPTSAPALRLDVTLSKVVEVLCRVATQPLEPDRLRTAAPSSGFPSDEEGDDTPVVPSQLGPNRTSQRSVARRSLARSQQRARRRGNTASRFESSSPSPSPSSSRQRSEARTSINPHYLAVMGVSEAELESGAVGNIRASWDTDDEDEESLRRLRGRSYVRPQETDDARGWVAEEDDDEDIGGAFARQYTPAIEEEDHGPRTRRRSTSPVTASNSNLEAKTETDSTMSKGKALTPDELHSDLIDVFECQLCYLLLCEPLTTPCGHTFCRSCFARSLDHSDKCPLCRSVLPNFAFFQEHPANSALVNLLTAELSEEEHFDDGEDRVGVADVAVCDDGDSWGFNSLYISRKEAVEREQREALLSTPLFVCTLGFPSMPTILHIFEPRYRLMIRRCLESNNPRFGMVLPSQSMAEPCPGMYRFGTMLEIKSVQMLPDGRSMIETVGSHRFKVLERGSLDGYTIGRIEPIADISDEEEDELEQRLFVERCDLSSLPDDFRDIATHFQSIIDQNPTTPNDASPENLATQPSTTVQLIEACTVFIDTLRSGSAPWLLTRLNHTYGPMPNPRDVVALGYWMALVMPIDEHEKAKLLPIRSAKVRLRIVVHWIEQLRQSWWFNNGCTVQ